MPFPPFDEDAPLKILVTGGSQGATILGEVVPEGLGLLPVAFAAGCRSSSNAGPTISSGPRPLCRARHPGRAATYIEDMPDKLADAHLVIGRAGASTIAELTAAGRPAILIPLPIATDDHQTANAARWPRPAARG
jgi:UDP-N-acetylglucosamine--N-acetylmuramyl-(pentapeptide) pyrophosphoryl-undecaprenol N-acetylglucosamine transferase